MGATAEDGDNLQEAEETAEEALFWWQRWDGESLTSWMKAVGGDVPVAEPFGHPVNHSASIDAGQLYPPPALQLQRHSFRAGR